MSSPQAVSSTTFNESFLTQLERCLIVADDFAKMLNGSIEPKSANALRRRQYEVRQGILIRRSLCD